MKLIRHSLTSWEKTCSTCRLVYKTDRKYKLRQFFHRGPDRSDGYCNQCKLCKNNRLSKDKRRDREQRRAKDPAERHKRNIRKQTRRLYGPATQFTCSRCQVAQAAEWHHMHYTKKEAVPLCEPCHTDVHVKKVTKVTLNIDNC